MLPKLEDLAREHSKDEIIEICPESTFITALNHVEMYIGRVSLYYEKIDGCHAGLRWPVYINMIERCLTIPLLMTSPWSLRISKGNNQTISFYIWVKTDLSKLSCHKRRNSTTHRHVA